MKMVFDTYEEFKKFAVDGNACPSDLDFKDTKKCCEPHSTDCYECWKNCGVDIEIKETLKHKICLIYSPSYERARKKLEEIISEKRKECIFTYENGINEAMFEDGECWKIVCNSEHFQGLRWSKCLIEEWNVTIGVLNRIVLPHAADGCRDNVEYF